ncbi:hypothetical protein RYX56_22720, partial [Alkalihalophilus lindianensis]
REGLPPIYLIIGASLAALLVLSLLFSTKTLLILFTVLLVLALIFMQKRLKRDKSVLLVAVGIWGFAAAFSGLAVPFLFKNVFKKYQADR